MSLRRASLIAVLCPALAAACAQTQSSTGDYPSGTVRIITPFAAGGISDTTSRVAADCLEEELGGTFIVENRDGGGGAIGMTEVANSKPDGNVISVVSMSTAGLVPLVTEGAEYDVEDFEPVSGITLAPSVLVVKGDSRFQNADELFAAAEAAGGDFSVAMPGSLGVFALTMNAITDAGGPKFTHVPYESNDQSVAAVLGGNADSAYVSTSPTLLEQLESGDLKALATGATEKVDFLPDVKTFAEIGYPDLPDSTVNVAMVAPAGVDESIRDTLAEGMAGCLESPDTAKVLGEEFVREDEPGPDVIGEEFDTTVPEWQEAVEE